ncbi:TonB-dependent receptor [Pelomonas sp. SE-A7]|uniref:TonB-dependent receptor domain-containing protein n=1 Tax=Pelomonas sp. SE-A7 TaxID=3054953 RepID=UPI00259D0578|nr:TonB-dependent receptor [Pelomonas sp. SE-A7]MDM4766392.1 TonB-dependent receptor [Pelomonas sp. SE-A7]
MSSKSQRQVRSLAASLRATPLALAALASLNATAQTSTPNKLDSVVVTATRSPQRLADVLADVTVLTRADIERQALGTLADLLRSQACFEIVRTGGPGAQTSMFVRGAETRHTTVLIDGVRFDSQASSGASWNAIPLSQIERVEIVRGPGAAVYGSDGIGGVVQIFTRKGNGKPQLDLGVGAGSLGTRKVDASAFGNFGLFDYALSLSNERSDGFNSRPTTDATFTPDADGYKTTSGSARLGLQLSKEQRLEFVGLKNKMKAQYDASAKPKTDDLTRNDMRADRLSWSSLWSKDLSSEVSIGESVDRYETSPSVYLTETRIRSYTANLSLRLGQGQLNTLVERREDKLLNTSLPQSPTPGSADRHQNAFGAGYVWGSGPLSFQVHARHDSDSEFGGSTTGSLAGGFRFTPQWSVQASLGTAFRAPTLYQRFSPYGNRQLQAEHGQNKEVGLRYEAGGTSFGLTAYRNLIDDLIIFGAADPKKCPNQFGCYENVSQARLQGLSLSAASSFGPLRLSGTLDLQAPKDVSSTSSYGKLLARRSKEQLKLRADYSVAGWELGAQVLASGHRFDNAANTVWLGGYTLLNLDAQYSLTKELRLQLKLDNAFDRKYQYANGYATGPRQAFVGLRWTPSL